MKRVPDGSTLARRSRRTPRQIVGFILGIGLVTAAVVAAAQQGDILHLLAPLASANPLLLAALLAATAATPIATAIGFWAATSRYGPRDTAVTPKEMTALIAAAWLLNYLPLWPGMFTRLAYHKAVNRITIRDAVKGIIWANALNTAAASALAAILLITLRASPLVTAAAAAAPAALALLSAIALRATAPRNDPAHWRLHLCFATRHAELHLWAARYWLVFTLLERPITWLASLALAALVTLAKTAPIAPNGVGVRTWAAGVTVTTLAALDVPIETRPAPPDADTLLALALTADLVVLAAELLVAVPMGLAAAAWIAAKRRKLDEKPAHNNENTPNPRPLS